MHILQIASEMTPIAKVGGLGDVLMGLTRELAWRGHDVVAVIPFYGVIDVSQLTADGREDWFDTEFNGVKQRARVSYFHLHNEIPVALLDTESGYFRSRQTIYGGEEEVSSFVYFSRAVAEWLQSTGRQPDVVHVHDWPTALFSDIYRAVTKKEPSFASIFTIHNFEYQGRCGWDGFAKAGLFRQDFPNVSRLQDPIYDCLNLVKGGLFCADWATTVSPTYAQEVSVPKGGTGLEKILASMGERFSGVLNGVDYTFLNPQIDPYLPEQYGLSKDGVARIRDVKQRIKERLFSSIGIPVLPGVPLLASVTRLVSQKGIYLIRDLFEQAKRLDFQCLLLGSVPEPGAERAFAELNDMLRSKGRGAVFLISDEAFAHQMYASSDMFVVPSLFEPCGLTQLIALKYGSIPIVRKTGGLADTIVDVSLNSEVSNGFTFEAPESAAFIAAATRALELFAKKPAWGRLMVRGMNQDFSWNRPGDFYLSLYEKASEN